MRPRSANRPAPTQSGSSLIVALILLVVMTLIVISVIRSTTVNSRVAGNLQVQKESEVAAQEAVEAVLTSNFQALPSGTTASPVYSVSNAASTSTVGQYTVTTTSKCVNVTPILVTQLNVTNPADASCFLSSSATIPGAKGGPSLCSSSNWDIEAKTSTTTGGATVDLHQGVSLRVLAGASC